MDRFVKTVVLTTLFLLAAIFISAFIGQRWFNNDFQGLDDVVETGAVKGQAADPHPVMELSGDAELGAFTIAALGGGIIIGYLGRRIFYENAPEEGKNDP